MVTLLPFVSNVAPPARTVAESTPLRKSLRAPAPARRTPPLRFTTADEPALRMNGTVSVPPSRATVPLPIPKLPSVRPLCVPDTVTLPDPETVSVPTPSKPTIMPVPVPLWVNEPPDTTNDPVALPKRPRTTSAAAFVDPPDWLHEPSPLRPMKNSEPPETKLPPDMTTLPTAFVPPASFLPRYTDEAEIDAFPSTAREPTEPARSATLKSTGTLTIALSRATNEPLPELPM